ncbi:MAG TPA: hypothetical protein VIQ01_01660 [Burkholderiales bacterium]
MKRLSFNEYQNLISGGKVLTRDAHGAKVVEAVDGRIIAKASCSAPFTSAMCS